MIAFPQRLAIRNSTGFSFGRSIGNVMLVAALGIFHVAASNAAARGEPAPVVDASGQPTRGSLESRLEVIERRLENQGLTEMLSRLDRLQQEMQNILGQIEVLNHDMDNIKKRQKDLYVDIDRRLTQMEQKTAALAKGQSVAPGPGSMGTPAAASGTPAMGSASGSTASTSQAPPLVLGTPPVSPQTKRLQREAYDRAFNLLKDGRYELAIASFKAYLETYPNADYADNAQYWLGEANYAQRRYDVALEEFNKVLDNYPKSSKRADAMLKMGFSYQELGKPKDAEAVLSNIVSMFPDTTAARLAKQRIQDIKRR